MKKFASTLVAWGPSGLFTLTLLDSAGIPIPGVVDALLVFLASKMPGLWLFYGALAVAGSLLGSLILFFIARKSGQRLLDRYTSYGRGAIFKEWYLRYGLITVFIPALSVIPMPLKFSVICSGGFGVRTSTFAGVILLARSLRYFGLAFLGSMMGENALAWIGEHKWPIATGLGILAIVLALLARYADSRRPPPVEAAAVSPR